MPKNNWDLQSPWRSGWLSTRVFLPGEFRGQRSLAGYSPWGSKRVRDYLATNTFTLHFRITYFCIFTLKNFLILWIYKSIWKIIDILKILFSNPWIDISPLLGCIVIYLRKVIFSSKCFTFLWCLKLLYFLEPPWQSNG